MSFTSSICSYSAYFGIKSHSGQVIEPDRARQSLLEGGFACYRLDCVSSTL